MHVTRYSINADDEEYVEVKYKVSNSHSTAKSLSRVDFNVPVVYNGKKFNDDDDGSYDSKKLFGEKNAIPARSDRIYTFRIHKDDFDTGKTMVEFQV